MDIILLKMVLEKYVYYYVKVFVKLLSENEVDYKIIFSINYIYACVCVCARVR